MAADDVFHHVGELTGLTAYDAAGEKIGSVEQAYLDNETGRAEWVTVKTGMFGMKESFVPLSGATRDANGLQFPHAKELVKDAPGWTPTSTSTSPRSRNCTTTTASPAPPGAAAGHRA